MFSDRQVPTSSSRSLIGRRTAAPTGTSHPPDIERTRRSALNVRRSARISMIPKAVMQGWRRLSVHRLLRMRLPAPQAEDHDLPCDGQSAADETDLAEATYPEHHFDEERRKEFVAARIQLGRALARKEEEQ